MGSGQSQSKQQYVNDQKILNKKNSFLDAKSIDFDKDIEQTPETLPSSTSLKEDGYNNIDLEDSEYRMVNTLRIKAIIEDYQKNGDHDVVSRNKKELYKKSAYCI